MKLEELLKKAMPDALIVVLFLVLSLFYFLTPLSEGLVLGGHDTVAGVGQGQEQKEYGKAHDGETTRWSNAIFSGMPTFQMAPSYNSSKTISAVSQIYSLGTEKMFPAMSYLFLYLLGFYILLRAFNFKPYLAALGSVIWAFSSYFLIIIAAGHIWKVMTLAYIPPTIGGLVLCYRGKYLWGGAVAALFTAFQIQSNHIQMTYYFLFVMLFLVIAYGIDAIVHRRLAHWSKATGVLIVAGLLGVAANLPNLYHTYSYAKESMRGKAELTPIKSQSSTAATDGLDRNYITAWSYGVGETLTLLIPDFKGGGSTSILDREGVEELPGYNDFYECAGQTQQAFQQQGVQAYPPGIQMYWGDQPFTVGPVYVGALVCFFFILALFYVKGPVKWALLASTLLSLVFAWGKNIPDVTNFIIDYMPMYAKFRTVSSALVIAEFTMPLLAVLCLYEIMQKPELFSLTKWKGADAPLRKRIGLPVAAILTLGICLALWLCPSLAGNCLSSADEETFKVMLSGGFPADFVLRYQSGLSSMHHAILSADALRSAIIILAGILITWAYAERKVKGVVMCSLLAVVCLFDLWKIDKRYLNDDSFTNPTEQLDMFAKTPADEAILKDTSYYRVANIGAGSVFNETSNATSYYHHSIGGYHAAKLHRYQDLIDRKLNAELQAFVGAISVAEGDMSQVNGDSIAPVLNMLNTKYFIFGSGQNATPVLNPYANGNGWFVTNLKFVDNADQEMAGLTGLDTKHAAVADKRFEAQLSDTALDSGTVRLISYQPNELNYEVNSKKGGVIVFSEIYYPGWDVTIDGQSAELGRVNYVLRALKVPAGIHGVHMEFRPASVRSTNAVAYVALLLIAALFVGGIVVEHKKKSEQA